MSKKEDFVSENKVSLFIATRSVPKKEKKIGSKSWVRDLVPIPITELQNNLKSTSFNSISVLNMQ